MFKTRTVLSEFNAQEFAAQLKVVKWRKIPRTCNTGVHALAKATISIA